MKKVEKKELSKNDKLLLYTPGRGKNTWSVYYSGRDENGKQVNFIYRLNISSLPFGFRYVKIYDSVLAMLSSENEFAAERDYGEIRKKDQLRYDELYFVGNCSRISGTVDLLELFAFINGGHTELKMKADEGSGFVMDSITGDVQTTFENIRNSVASFNLKSEGIIDICGNKYSADGVVWAEKQYAEFPKGRVKKKNAEVIKLRMIPENMSEAFLLYSVNDRDKHEISTEMTIFSKDPGSCMKYCDSPVFTTVESWISTHTDIAYPVKMEVEVPEEEMKVSITARTEDQELYTVSRREKVGEYVGAGEFEGIYKGKQIKGVCFIEKAL